MAEEQAITAGSVVVVKSGSPLMTVEELTAGLASCVWFEDKKIHRASFVIALLEPRDPNEFRF